MTKPHILINLTNHPSERWGDKQKEAAMRYGKTIDIPFPIIEPDGDEEYIMQISEEYFSKILQYTDEYCVTVHLMGEFSFTFALIKLLQENSISCIASTTSRMVKDIDNGRKEITFEFQRFREYR